MIDQAESPTPLAVPPARVEPAKPRLGRSPGYVELADTLRIGHRVLKMPILIGYDEIASAVVLSGDSSLTEHGPFLARPLRPLPLGGPGRPNLALVLRRTQLVSGFRRGAYQALSISAREGRRGVGIDVLVLRVDNAEQLVQLLQQRGVRCGDNSMQAMIDVAGELPAALVPQVRAEV